MNKDHGKAHSLRHGLYSMRTGCTQRTDISNRVPDAPQDAPPATRFNYGHYGALRKTREQANTF